MGAQDSRAISRLMMPAFAVGIFALAIVSTAPRPTDGHLSGIDCWHGLPGKSKAWHLACCELGGWQDCWTEELTADLCCNRTAAPGEHPLAGTVPEMSAEEGLEAVREFLGFSGKELQLFLAGIKDPRRASEDSDAWMCRGCEAAGGRRDTGGSPENLAGGPARQLRCYTPWDCAQEAFARFYQRGWDHGLLPIRHPWFSEETDPHFAMGMKMREENDGWSPKGHERTFERVQLADWLEKTSDFIRSSVEELPGEKRCLEWDASTYSRRYFKGLCELTDMIMFEEERPYAVPRSPTGSLEYRVDLHEADRIIAPGSIAVSVCVQVFEHLKHPNIAMAQLFKLTAPGGWVVWSAPLFSMIHGDPHDYWRFTPYGAKLLAQEEGFEVLGMHSPGSLRELSGYLVGINAPYWSKEAMIQGTGSDWPLQVYMLLRRPPDS